MNWLITARWSSSCCALKRASDIYEGYYVKVLQPHFTLHISWDVFAREEKKIVSGALTLWCTETLFFHNTVFVYAAVRLLKYGLNAMNNNEFVELLVITL